MSVSSVPPCLCYELEITVYVWWQPPPSYHSPLVIVEEFFVRCECRPVIPRADIVRVQIATAVSSGCQRGGQYRRSHSFFVLFSLDRCLTNYRCKWGFSGPIRGRHRPHEGSKPIVHSHLRMKTTGIENPVSWYIEHGPTAQCYPDDRK